MRQHLAQNESSITENSNNKSQVLAEIKHDYNNAINPIININSNIFQTIFDQVNQLIYILDPQGKILMINKTAIEFSNCNRDEIIGKNIWDTSFWTKCPENRMKIKEGVEKIMNGECAQVETKFIQQGSEVYYIDFTFKPIFDDNNEIKMIIQEGTDITCRKNTENYLQEIATHDSLTGLPNERLLYDRLNQSIIRSRRNNHLLAVLFIDLDGFKKINDSFGHQAGDLILQAASIRIIDSLRENDTVARIGGDEFIVIMEDFKELHHIITVSERLLSSIKKPFKNDEINCSSLTASIGISIFPYDGTDAEMLLKKADCAMYQVKNENKNDYKIFI